MLPIWTVSNNYKLAELEENTTVSIALPLASTEGVTTSVISGALPQGLRLENNQILGTPVEVDRPITSTVVIRASTDQGIADRTFFILINGADDPQWITAEGRLPIGSNNVFFILDNSLIDFQLLASDTDLPAGQSLEFKLTGGELPPGIQLTGSGKLTGIVDPLLALDINVINGNYDGVPLDVLPYDFGLESGDRIPRKLNREYFFRVTVSDNVSSVNRHFQIFVVGDDFAKADNTIMKAADGVFTADFTFLRVPLWLTPGNLGVKRANNYLTIFLDAFDSNTIAGELQYFLETINDDGTPSVVPPGLALDSVTGELAGRIPYQPAVTRDYKFSVSALRFNSELGLFTVFGTYTEDTLANKTATLKIGKTPRTLFEGLTELQSLVGKQLTIENKQYTVISVNETSPDFDTITVDRLIEPLIAVTPLTVKETISNQDFFFVNPITQSDRDFYFKKVLRYSDTEVYEIIDAYPYIEWEITASSNDPVFLIETHDSTLIEANLEAQFGTLLRDAYITVERNSFDQVIKINMRIPATAQNRNKSYIQGLFETEDSGSIDAEAVGEFDRIKLNNTTVRTLNATEIIAMAVVRGGSFNNTFSRLEDEVASKKKTFTVRLLGEVDSVITWLTPTNLETLPANRISTLFVRAKTTVTDSAIRYSIVGGVLPPGLLLSQDGEIIGKVPVTGTETVPGLIRFIDNGSPTTFDFGNTTFDREYKFTVLASDRFKYSAVEREFTIKISDEDNLNYSNIFFKPFLNTTQRRQFNNLVDNARIFTPDSVYRPGDPNFGIQKTLRCLVYAGIENLNLENYVAAVAKNHKRKKFYPGKLKTAIAKIPGTDQVLYEIVYVELVDRAQSSKGFTDKLRTASKNKITVDSVNFETKDDNTVSTIGTVGITVLLNSQNLTDYFLINNVILTNSGTDVLLTSTDPVEILLNSGLIITIPTESIDELIDHNLLPDRYRPTGNTIKADSNAITLDQDSNNVRYTSSIGAMRQQIKNTEADNNQAVSNRDFLPLWMRTPQPGSLSELGYVLALPVAYTKPGESSTIKENIENSNFDFKILDFDIDRYIIDNTSDVNREQYILFANYQFNV